MAPPDSSQSASDPERRAWLFGIPLGLLLTVGMLQVWQNWYLLAWGWFFLFSFVGPFVPRRRPAAKMTMIALAVATYLSLLLH
jgi:hypothetical protein